jgi:hypothetical protein
MTFLKYTSNLPFIVSVIHVEPFLYPGLYFRITSFVVFVVTVLSLVIGGKVVAVIIIIIIVTMILFEGLIIGGTNKRIAPRLSVPNFILNGITNGKPHRGSYRQPL